MLSYWQSIELPDDWVPICREHITQHIITGQIGSSVHKRSDSRRRWRRSERKKRVEEETKRNWDCNQSSAGRRVYAWFCFLNSSIRKNFKATEITFCPAATIARFPRHFLILNFPLILSTDSWGSLWTTVLYFGSRLVIQNSYCLVIWKEKFSARMNSLSFAAWLQSVLQTL